MASTTPQNSAESATLKIGKRWPSGPNTLMKSTT